MSEMFACVLCGRRGPQGFVMVAADPNAPEQGHRARCANRKACQARIDARNAEVAETAPAAEVDGQDPSDTVPAESSAASLAGLAREVEGLRTAVLQLRGKANEVDDLARVVTELATQVQAKLRRPAAPHPPSWLTLPPDTDAARSVLSDLVAWLSEVYLRYADAAKAFPECWMWHPDVVEELLCLMVAWHGAYRVEDAPVSLAGDWHDRQRPGVAKRIKTLAGSCSLDNHQPGGQQGSRPVVPLAEAMAPIAAWWGEHRDEAPPAPTEEQLARSAERAPVSWGGGRR